MFEKNDKALLTARNLILVFIAIFGVASLVGGIVLAVTINIALILLSVIGILICLLIWVFSQLYLSYLCDIKLIRNKLYGESNKNLDVFFKAENEIDDSPEMQAKRAEMEAELQHLQQLLSSGIITTEEYEKRKKELTEGR